MTRYHLGRNCPVPTDEMKEGFFQCTNGNIGMILALLDTLFYRRGFLYMPITSFNWRTVIALFFVDLPALFRTIHDDLGIRKALSLPHPDKIATASELLDQAVGPTGHFSPVWTLIARRFSLSLRDMVGCFHRSPLAVCTLCLHRQCTGGTSIICCTLCGIRG
ncbi:hypothetical protein BJX65DRAFT_40198 [Aspergillus insuetus]